MKHDVAEEAFLAGRLSSYQSDHGLIFLPFSDLAGTADGFHLCTHFVELVERGKAMIKATADPARTYALTARLSARGGLEFRVLYVEPQQTSDDTERDDRAWPAAVEGGARTHTGPLQPPPKLSEGEASRNATTDPDAAAADKAVQPALPDSGASVDSTEPRARGGVSEQDGRQAQARENAAPQPPCPPHAGAEAQMEPPETSGELFKPTNATVLALRDAKDTRLANRMLRAVKAGRLKYYEDFIEELKKAYNPLRVRELLTSTFDEGHVTTDRLGPLDWSELEGITKAVKLRHAMFVRGQIGPIGAPGSLQCRLHVEALLSREHDEVVKSLVHKGNLNCALLDRNVALKIAPLWDRGSVRVKLGVKRELKPEARFEVTIEEAYLEQCDDERRSALAHEVAEKVRRAPPAEPEWTMVDPWPMAGADDKHDH